MVGVSFSGGVSRCFAEWQRFAECYTAQRTSDVKQCTPIAEDYQECLHHVKEKKRALTIAQELSRQQAKGEEISPIQPEKKVTAQELGLVN